MVAGNWKVKNRQLYGLSETQLIAKQRQLMKKLVAETLK